MKITVELPDDVAQHPDPGREALEAPAIEGYRARKLKQFQVGKLLGLSRIQTEDLLARHTDLYDYSTGELEAESRRSGPPAPLASMLAISNTSPLRCSLDHPPVDRTATALAARSSVALST